jgi:hypothetical protein
MLTLPIFSRIHLSLILCAGGHHCCDAAGATSRCLPQAGGTDLFNLLALLVGKPWGKKKHGHRLVSDHVIEFHMPRV